MLDEDPWECLNDGLIGTLIETEDAIAELENFRRHRSMVGPVLATQYYDAYHFGTGGQNAEDILVTNFRSIAELLNDIREMYCARVYPQQQNANDTIEERETDPEFIAATADLLNALVEHESHELGQFVRYANANQEGKKLDVSNDDAIQGTIAAVRLFKPLLEQRGLWNREELWSEIGRSDYKNASLLVYQAQMKGIPER